MKNKQFNDSNLGNVESNLDYNKLYAKITTLRNRPQSSKLPIKRIDRNHN